MNRKGSVMAEAALVFPLVILTVAALIYMFQIFFRHTEVRAGMHRALRAESGRICETLQYGEPVQPPFPIYRKGSRLYCRGTLRSKSKGILDAQEKTFLSEKYVDDERDYIRRIELLEGEARADE